MPIESTLRHNVVSIFETGKNSDQAMMSLPLFHQGEEIPLECRGIAIVDAYDAMTSERPYKRTLVSMLWRSCSAVREHSLIPSWWRKLSRS